MVFYQRRNRAFILIFSLWVLGVLTVLAVSVAAGIRQRVLLVKKLEERSRMQYLLQGALEQARSYVRGQCALAQFGYSAALKMALHNNPGIFAHIDLGDDTARVSFTAEDGDHAAERFGVVDEERKINLNTTSVLILERLIEQVLGLKPSDASLLAGSILDWRKVGESQLTGFYSDEYYANLQFPFKKKDADYEVLDELLLIKGMTKEYYRRLLPYVTIYGDGKVNINTASAVVLNALGLDDVLVQKIITVRRGKDEIEGTLDDVIFTQTFDIASGVDAVIKLLPAEARSIDAINSQGLLSVSSNFFSVGIQGSLINSSWQRQAYGIFSVRDNRVLYWREK